MGLVTLHPGVGVGNLGVMPPTTACPNLASLARDCRGQRRGRPIAEIALHRKIPWPPAEVVPLMQKAMEFRFYYT